MSQDRIALNIQGLVDALATSVFTDPQDILRELLMNAQDACILRKMQDPGFESPRVAVEAADSVLTVSDNGIGMTEEELRQYFSTIGASSKRFDRVAPFSDATSVERRGLTGAFGLGVLAYFMVAERIEITTRSFKPQSPTLLWSFDGGDSYRIEQLPDGPVGTKVTLHLKQKYADLASESFLLETVQRLWRQSDIPIFVDGKTLPPPHVREQVNPGQIEPAGIPPAGFRKPEGTRADEAAFAVLRIELAGKWSARDFASWLNELESSYTRLSAFLLASDADPEILRVATQPYMATVRPNSEFAPVLRLVRSRVRDLRLHRIQLSSPGFVELLGSLNPIKTIADFIIAWRHENTLREQSALEHRRALADRAAEIIKSAPSPAFVDRFLKFALEEPTEQLTHIAQDVRLENVSWKQIGDGDAKDNNPASPTQRPDPSRIT